MLAAEIDCLDAVRGERVARVLRFGEVRVEERDRIGAVDDDTAVPVGQTVQRFFEIDPTDSHQDDIGVRGLTGGASLDRWAPFARRSEICGLKRQSRRKTISAKKALAQALR